MGAVRTTFAMVAAVIVRRKMLLDKGLEDPYASRLSLFSNIGSGAQKMGSGNSGTNTASL